MSGDAFTPEQKGSLVLAIQLLAQALANDDWASAALAKRQLIAMFRAVR